MARKSRMAVRVLNSATLVGITVWVAGCASASKQNEALHAELEGTRTQVKDSQAKLTALTTRVEALESKLGSLGDKVDSMKTSLENTLGVKKLSQAPIPVHPSENTGTPVGTGTLASNAEHDPEGALSNDEPVQVYRKAKILFSAQKYPEAVLAFSSFLQQHADHPLAGQAQYYVGESYMRQKEYKLALQEFTRVLTSYDRSSTITDTLSQMIEAEEQLKRKDEAAKHRQMLLSMFPNSPAALMMGPAQPSSAPAQAAAPKSVATQAKAPPTAPLPKKKAAADEDDEDEDDDSSAGQ